MTYGQRTGTVSQKEWDSAARAGSVKKSDRLLRQENKSHLDGVNTVYRAAEEIQARRYEQCRLNGCAG
jgi:hypothetical protein